MTADFFTFFFTKSSASR